jgi:peroxiredoxin
MKPFLFYAICASTLLTLVLSAETDDVQPAQVGQTAPNFSLTGGDGKKHSLSDYKGKYVVLEWTNPQCPFVHKFYDSGAMQNLQKEETAKGVVWLRINSSAAGTEGSQTQEAVAAYEKANNVASTETLLDPSGKVGHLYGARNTPQMFVIDPKGDLIYAGGIDDKPSPDAADIPTAKNYVIAALEESMAGKPVSTPTAKPYGCSVKYAKD